jgi:hypothetical protein
VEFGFVFGVIIGSEPETESNHKLSPPFAVRSGGFCFVEARGVRGPNLHAVFSLRHRSHFTCSSFLTHLSFWEWQRLHAERVFPGGLLDSFPGESPNTEAGLMSGVLKTFMLI